MVIYWNTRISLELNLFFGQKPWEANEREKMWSSIFNFCEDVQKKVLLELKKTGSARIIFLAVENFGNGKSEVALLNRTKCDDVISWYTQTHTSILCVSKLCIYKNKKRKIIQAKLFSLTCQTNFPTCFQRLKNNQWITRIIFFHFPLTAFIVSSQL